MLELLLILGGVAVVAIVVVGRMVRRSTRERGPSTQEQAELVSAATLTADERKHLRERFAEKMKQEP